MYTSLTKTCCALTAPTMCSCAFLCRQARKLVTTDYVITAYEPRQHNFTVYTDNAGSDSSGLWRAGMFYTNKSLTGNRDTLMVSGIFSEGTKSRAALPIILR